MKNIICSLALFGVVSLGASSTATATPVYKDVILSISEVFVPEGLKPDSDAYVVVSGMFPNSCYSWKTANVTNITPLIHEIKSVASVAQQMCLMVMIPFQKQVQFGHFIGGTHTLRFMNGDGTFFERSMKIEN